MNAESQRLQVAHAPQTPWKKWGPYLSQRQWGITPAMIPEKT
jgi:hypothetical protein